jgi:hypothetical protein
MTKSKELMAILNHHLATHINEKLSISDSYRAIKINDFTITYKGNRNYKGDGAFLSVKFRGYKFKSRLYDGFLVNITELSPVGVFFNKLPFYNDIVDIHEKLQVYTNATTHSLYLAKIFVYFPLNGDKLRYLLVFDTGDNFIFVSDIPEMLTNPVEFRKGLVDNFYHFFHVQDDFKTKIDNLFFENYQQRRNMSVSRDDFLVAIMETI